MENKENNNNDLNELEELMEENGHEPEVHLSEDLMKTYLHEIGKEPLLSREEEVVLAKAIAQGQKVWKAVLKRYPDAVDDVRWLNHHFRKLARTFSAKEIEKLKLRMEARERLAMANLRLVVSIAKKHSSLGLPLLDLIQEGNIGLMKAIEKFDYTKGYKFSTYATWWIRQAISRAIADKARTIRIPTHMLELMRKMYKAEEEYVQEYGEPPSTQYLAHMLKMPISEIERAKKISHYTRSFEEPIGDEDEGSSLGDFIGGKEGAVREALKRLQKEELRRILEERLSFREREILKLRFGLEKGGQTLTLEEVGERFNLSRERIRQIEKEALEKLRHILPKESFTKLTRLLEESETLGR